MKMNIHDNDHDAILPDFTLLSSEQLEAWLVLYARAMVKNSVDDLPVKLIEFVQEDPKVMSRLNDIYEQILVKSESYQPYHLVVSADPIIHSNNKSFINGKMPILRHAGYVSIAAVVLIFMLSFLSIYLYIHPQIEPTQNLALQYKIDSLNKEITLLQIKSLKEDNNPIAHDTIRQTSKVNPTYSNDDTFFASQKVKYHHQFQPDQTKELLIAEAFTSRGGKEQTTENPFSVKVFSPEQRVVNQVNFRWEINKDKQKHIEPLRFRLYNNQKKIKDFSLDNNKLQLNQTDGLTDGLYYWTLEAEDQQIFIGKFEFYTK